MNKKIQSIIKKFKPHTIKSIEKEIDENKKRLDEIEYKFREEYDEDCPWLENEVIEIKKYNKILDLKKQHKIDRRDNGWTSKFIWLILAPIIVAVVVSLLIID